MSLREFYLDHGVGENRGVVTLDGRPERLLISRDGDDERLKVGARLIGRVRRVEPAIGSAFIDLGGGAEGFLQVKPEARPIEGASLEVEVRAEPRRGKLAMLREVGAGEGPPRLISAAPDLAGQLAILARGAPVITGPAARLVADEAQADVLETLFPLPGGGDLAIEPTRALTAIDVDLGERKGVDGKRVTRQANLTALAAAARLLRLKGLGGLVVIDLVGRGHDGAALLAQARAAFAPDNPGVAIGPVTKFGAMEMSIPRRVAPLHEVLCRADGEINDQTLALALIRDLQTQAQAQPGGRFACFCAPPVATAAQALAEKLAMQIGHRFSITAAADRPRASFEVKPQ